MRSEANAAVLDSTVGVGASLLAVLPEPSVSLSALYIALILGGTAAYVYALRKASFGRLVLAMYFPGALALVFVALGLDRTPGNSASTGLMEWLLWALRGRSHAWADPLADGVLRPLAPPSTAALLAWCVVGCVLPVAVIGVCAITDVALGWGQPVPEHVSTSDHNRDLFVSFLRAAGEELGWRCYLLPLLNASCDSYVTACVVSGVVWGLYHVPVMVLLVNKLKVHRPWLTCTVQGVNLLVQGFMYAWLGAASAYALWPCALMHWVWNRVNPTVLGSIYTQTPGKVQGEQWLINGEGLVGIVVGLPIAAVIAVAFP